MASGFFVKSWTKELLCLALSAAFFAVAIPRVLLPPLASAQRVPAALRANARRDPAPPTSIALDSPDASSPIAQPPLAESPDVLDARAARRLRGSARSARPAPLPPGLSYVDHRWVADMRVLPPPRVALAGVAITPPGEGGVSDGYRVERVDRLGLFRAAGIAPGDVLIGVDGMPLRSPDDALDALSRLRGATRATFLFQRGATRYQVPVELVGTTPGRPLPL